MVGGGHRGPHQVIIIMAHLSLIQRPPPPDNHYQIALQRQTILNQREGESSWGIRALPFRTGIVDKKRVPRFEIILSAFFQKRRSK